MKSTPFDPETDLPPIPFTHALCETALSLKKSGLPWEPHVGCFVWDPEETIPVDSPFPNRIYFILNLGHFLKFYASKAEMAQRLVWLPTWDQAKLLVERFRGESSAQNPVEGTADTSALYQRLIDLLRSTD